MKLFVSYARVDMPNCKKLVTLLEAQEVWYDQNLVGGQKWWQTILEKIDWCEGFLYLLSPESVESPYCQKECKIALSSNRIVIPVVIQDRTEVPQYLKHLQYVNLSKGLDDVDGIVQLMNALFEAERQSRAIANVIGIDQFSREDNEPPKVERVSTTQNDLLPYNYVFRLHQRGVTENTKVVYYRWVCEFLEAIADEPYVAHVDRKTYLSTVPIGILRESISVGQVKAWLGMLVADKRQVSQAKSALITLAQLLAEDHIIDENLVYKLKNIDISGLNDNEKPRRILEREEIEKLIREVEKGNSAMSIRDAVVVSLFMVLRSGEVSQARWKNIQTVEAITHFKNSNKLVELPQIASRALARWRDYLAKLENKTFPDTESYIVRRFMKGSVLTEYNVTSRTLGKTFNSISERAGIGIVNPEELRISVSRVTQAHGVSTLF